MPKSSQYRFVARGTNKYNLIACQCPRCKKILVVKSISPNLRVQIDSTTCECGYTSNQINTSEMDKSMKDAFIIAGVISFFSLFTVEISIYMLFAGLIWGASFIVRAAGAQAIYKNKINEAKSLLLKEEGKLYDLESNKNQRLWKAYQEEVEIFKKNNSGRLVVKKDGEKFYIGKDKLNLYLMPCNETQEHFLCGIDTKSVEANQIHNIIWSKTKTIPISKIDYFTLTGDVSYGTKISGGNSGIGGAAVGYALGGSLGAALLANPTEIKSEEVKHDERRVYLQYSKDNKTYSLNFMPEELASIRELLPDKEYSSSTPLTKPMFKTTTKDNETNKADTFEILKKLSELKGQGVITEEEFNQKKTELLKNL